MQKSVTVHVKREVSSSRAQAGDTTALQVADDVVVHGYIVTARGADGMAEVTSAAPAGAHTPGTLNVLYRRVRDVDCSKIGVAGTSSLSGRSSSGGGNDPSATLSEGSNVAQSAGIARVASVLQPASGSFKNLTAHAKGHDASLEPDLTISLEVSTPNGVSIVSSSLTQPMTKANDDSDVA
jgi:hypothetical protein